MQLAATHITFMVQQQTKEDVCYKLFIYPIYNVFDFYFFFKQTIPDFPGTLQEFKDFVLRYVTIYIYIDPTKSLDAFYFILFYRTSSSPNDSFMAFLEGLAGGKEKIDNLRLPLQVALLISPIFLLQDTQIHLSAFYVQRHKIILVRTNLFIFLFYFSCL